MTTLQNHILEIQQGIKRGRFSNKATISQGIILRLLQALGWPTYDIQLVLPKYAISNHEVDYALCSSPNKPIIFIAITEENVEEEQNHILANAQDAEAPLTILTDGTKWHFYFTSKQDHFKKILICKLDLLVNSVGEIVQSLDRYLAYEKVCSGESNENAFRDSTFRENQISTILQAAWSQLLIERSGSLVTMIADEVEKSSGYRPDKGAILSFLTKLSDEPRDVSNTWPSQSSMSRMRRFLYWLFAITPIILHVVINLSFWCHLPGQQVNYDFWCGLPDPNASSGFWYYMKFIWFAPVFWVFMNLGGLWQGFPQDIKNANTHERQNASNALLIISYVSKGVNQETLSRAIRQTQGVLDSKNLNYTIEVVSDNQIVEEKRILVTKGPVHYYVVPEDYQTETKVKYKARALQYLLEQRTNRLSVQKEWNIKDVWVLHLDEESVLTEQAVIGVENFIKKHSLRHSDGAIGQGEILYNSYKYGKNLLITAADALRTGDDLGRFRFQYKVLNKPVSGMHGSFLLTPASIEHALNWDSGARSQITEDAYFALKAMQQNIHFDWIDGFIKEQSPFTFRDFVNQRVRWYCGLALVTTDKKLKLSTRIVLGITIVSWSVTWVGTFVTFGNIAAGWIIGETYFPFWAVFSTSIITGLVGSVYMIGAYRNASHWDAPIWKKLLILLATYFLFMVQFLALMEGLAVIRSIMRLIRIMIFKTLQDFYVVAKD